MATILIAEDHPPSREWLTTLLRYKGYEVLEAADGVEALRIARTHSLDLIISDILMPEKDGYEFVRELRANPRTPHTPVIFYSATYIAEEARSLASACGVHQFLTKPLEPELMLKVVEETLRSANAAGLPTTDEAFDRRHLRLVSDRLSHKVKELEYAIAERELLQEQLLHAQKMECVGRLAGGIAHDFNNLLTVVMGSTELAADELPATRPSQAYLRDVIHATVHAGKLTHQLLAFARKQVIAPTVVDLTDLILKTATMLRRLLGEDIELVIPRRTERGSVLVDVGQIEQVLVNLAVNAGDAMPEGGTLTIETANISLGEFYVRQHSDVTPGKYVMLAVSDTGIGMDKTVQAQLFEPFFTTKEAGKGTGLGLATCYGIIKQSGGHIGVESKPGRGTTFRIYLPQVDEIASDVAAPRESADIGGTETVLVVEDDAMVRAIALNVLRAFGYLMLEAANGKDALRVAEEHNSKIDLLITDVVMPELRGKELAEKLTTVRPDTKVLFTSGYTDDVVTHDGNLDRNIAFLQKPYTAAGLARKVREVLDSGHQDKMPAVSNSQ